MVSALSFNPGAVHSTNKVALHVQTISLRPRSRYNERVLASDLQFGNSLSSRSKNVNGDELGLTNRYKGFSLQ